MSNERIRRVLYRVAESLSVHGWTQGKMYDAYSGASCLTGAINKNCEFLADRDKLYIRILEQIHPGCQEQRAHRGLPPLEYLHHRDEIEREIVRWNDDPERRVEDVLAMLARASSTCLLDDLQGTT